MSYETKIFSQKFESMDTFFFKKNEHYVRSKNVSVYHKRI